MSKRDPLLLGATQKQLETYDVLFETKKPLGIVLERSREWALVKLSNAEASDVTGGSALRAINDKSVELSSYSNAIKLLTGWKPPLKLSFIKAPEKEGNLAKLSRGRRGSVKNWKDRFFILKQGKLAYYDNESGATPELKGCVQLMGSAVSLVPYHEVDQHFCFRLVSGVATLIMQAETVEQMLDWATTLYHAIAIANGGGYLLDIARENAKKEEQERAKKLKLRKMEQEAEAAKKRAEEERLHREEAERKAAEAEAAKVEAEKKRLEAEQAQAADEVAAAVEAEKRAAEEAAEAEAEKLAAEAAAQEAETAAEEVIKCVARMVYEFVPFHLFVWRAGR